MLKIQRLGQQCGKCQIFYKYWNQTFGHFSWRFATPLTAMFQFTQTKATKIKRLLDGGKLPDAKTINFHFLKNDIFSPQQWNSATCPPAQYQPSKSFHWKNYHRIIVNAFVKWNICPPSLPLAAKVLAALENLPERILCCRCHVDLLQNFHNFNCRLSPSLTPKAF